MLRRCSIQLLEMVNWRRKEQRTEKYFWPTTIFEQRNIFATLRMVMINLWLRPAMNNALAQSPLCHIAEHKVTSEEGLPLKAATIGMTKDFWGLQFPMPQS